MITQWFIYIPGEGDWKIKYNGDDPKKAREIYLKWAKRKRLPNGSEIWFRTYCKHCGAWI